MRLAFTGPFRVTTAGSIRLAAEDVDRWRMSRGLPCPWWPYLPGLRRRDRAQPLELPVMPPAGPRRSAQGAGRGGRSRGTGGDLSAALASWHEAIALLPAESRQYAAIADRIARLGRQVEAGPVPKPRRRLRQAAHVVPLAHAGPAAPFRGSSPRWRSSLWKFKFLAVVLLTKAKFLLLGLTKASTFLSMFAVGGGLLDRLRRVVRAGARACRSTSTKWATSSPDALRHSRRRPLFVPGLGAFIRLKQALTDPRQDARVGLAGPIWGLGAALVACGVRR